jgi:hypothetical protein
MTTAIIQTYLRHLNGRSAIVFCTDRAHAMNVCKALDANQVVATPLYADHNMAQRYERLGAMVHGRLRVICCTTGMAGVLRDINVDAIIMAAPTASAKRLSEMLAVLRKDDKAIVVDLAGNFARLGIPDTFNGRALIPPFAGMLPGVIIDHDPAYKPPARDWSLDRPTKTIGQPPTPCNHIAIEVHIEPRPMPVDAPGRLERARNLAHEIGRRSVQMDALLHHLRSAMAHLSRTKL